MRRWYLAVIPLTLAATLAGCGSASTSSTAATGTSTATVSGTTRTVPLTEYKVGVPTTLPAGKYALNIVNSGKIEHELLVLKSDLAPSAYPLDGSAIKEDGAGITKISDGDNISAGQSQSRELDLTAPGKYLFVCNLPGHFASGMYTEVIVK